MFGSSKFPTSRGRNLGDGQQRAPNMFDRLRQIPAQLSLERQATLASRAATAPQENAARTPAVAVTGNWLQRTAEATTQRLRRTFGRYLHLTPDGTAEMSRVAAVAHGPARIQAPDQRTDAVEHAMQKPSQVQSGVSVQQITLPRLAGGDRMADPAYRPNPAVADFLAMGRGAAKPTERVAGMHQEVKQAAQAKASAAGKDQSARSPRTADQGKDTGVERGVDE